MEGSSDGRPTAAVLACAAAATADADAAAAASSAAADTADGEVKPWSSNLGKLKAAVFPPAAKAAAPGARDAPRRQSAPAADCRVPRTAAARGVGHGTTSMDANSGGGAAKKTGVVWRQAEHSRSGEAADLTGAAVTASSGGGGGGGGDVGGAVVGRQTDCGSGDHGIYGGGVRERPKVAFKLPSRRSAVSVAADASKDPTRPSPMAALARKRRRSWTANKHVSRCSGPVPHAPPRSGNGVGSTCGGCGGGNDGTDVSGGSICGTPAAAAKRLGMCSCKGSEVGAEALGGGDGVGDVLPRASPRAEADSLGLGSVSSTNSSYPVFSSGRHRQEQRHEAASIVVGPVPRLTATYFDEEMDEVEEDGVRAGASSLTSPRMAGLAHELLQQQQKQQRSFRHRQPCSRQEDGETEPPLLLDILEEARRAVSHQRKADEEELGRLEPASFIHAKGTPRTPKGDKDKKPPLVIELLPTCWRVRTISTERQRHGNGHKKTANLQYCFASRQVMLDLDNGRFPLALMWALPEVLQGGGDGAVLAEIHDLRGTGVDAKDPAVSTTLLQPFGEVKVCPKGTHHPPGLGQGPGQGERFASDGSYIASGGGGGGGGGGIGSSSSSRKDSSKGSYAPSGSGAPVGGGEDSGRDDTADPRLREGAHKEEALQQKQRQEQQGCSSDESPRVRLSIVVPKPAPSPSPSPSGPQRLTLLFPEKRVPDSVSVNADPASIHGRQRSPQASPASAVSAPLPDGAGAEVATAGLGKEGGLDRSLSTGDAGEVSPVRVLVPPPGSVTLVKPRVRRVRLKVNRGAWMASLWEEILSAARKCEGAKDAAAKAN
ncbi:unnamed protein product, partial [Scytosiphon promiscuus]